MFAWSFFNIRRIRLQLIALYNETFGGQLVILSKSKCTLKI